MSEASLNRDMLDFVPAIQQYISNILEADGYDGDQPAVFDAIFGLDDDQAELRQVLRDIYRTPNHDTVEAFIDDQLRDMAHQFNRIPSLKSVDNILMENDDKTLVESL